MQILYSENHIQFQIEKLGRKITEHFKRESSITYLVFLKGAGMFASDLVKRVNVECELEYIFNNKSMEEQISKLSLDNKNIVIIEDIVDTGKTIKEAKKILEGYELKSLTVVSLLIRGDERLCDVDFFCFNLVTPEFVIGYGLDQDEKFRNLPYIAVNND